MKLLQLLKLMAIKDMEKNLQNKWNIEMQNHICNYKYVKIKYMFIYVTFILYAWQFWTFTSMC